MCKSQMLPIKCGVPQGSLLGLLVYVYDIPYYRKLTLHEIKVLEINANLMENDFRIKKINAKEEAEFHKKEINAIILAEINGEDIDITSDSDNNEDGLEVL